MSKIKANSTVLLIGLLIGQQLYLTQVVRGSRQDISKIAGTVAFDIDLARKTFMIESEFLFMQGCLSGTKREPSLVTNPGFDTNSPQNYCSNKSKDWRDYWEYHGFKLGRKE